MRASSHHQPASIDANSINVLMKVMRTLESADFPMDVDKIWNDCFPVPCQGDAKTCQDMLDPLIGLKSTLKELKHLLSTFGYLAKSLERKISSVNAIYFWMNAAPVEVLDNIFEMACFEDNRTVFNLSLVNKRFHDTVMSNPRLWNKICNFPRYGKASLGQLQVSLKHGKDVGLDVEMNFIDGKAFPDGIEILGIAVSEVSRWESVFYGLGGGYGGDWRDLFRDISRYSTGLDLPRLKSATLSYPKLFALNENVSEGIIDLSEPLMHFYTTWYLPSLTNLTVQNLIPRRFLHLAPPLTTLTLSVDEYDYENMPERMYDMNLLLEFLRSSPLLETFCLHLNRLTPSTKYGNHTLPETVLPNLQTFEFTAQYMTLTAQSLLPFTKALRFPSLRELHVCVDADMDIINLGGNVWLDCVLPHSYEQYMNVEVFSYKTRTFMELMKAGHHNIPYDVPFAKLHNLRSITLETPCFKPNFWKVCHDDWTCTMRLPKLRNVRFVRCDALDEVELRSFKELLEKQGRWDTLKGVTFQRFKSVNQDTVRSLFEGKDVIWEEY